MKSPPNNSFCGPFGHMCGRLFNTLLDASRHQGQVSSPWCSQCQAALRRSTCIGRGSKSTEEVRIEVVRVYPL